MSFYLNPQTAKQSARNFFLIAFIPLFFFSSPLFSQEGKEISSAPPAASIMPASPVKPDLTSSTAEPANNTLLNIPSHGLLPATPHVDTISNSVSTGSTTAPISSPQPTPLPSRIESNSLSTHSIPLAPGTSSKPSNPGSTRSKSLPPGDSGTLSSTLSRSKLPAKLGETPIAPVSTDSNTDTNSSSNAATIAAISSNPNEKISIQFPHTSILEALSLYEKLTGKRIIRDSNLAGPELSLMIADPVSKKDAISLLESTMLVNGYTVVPVDDKTIKVIGPSRPPRMEGLPLYQNVSELPNDGERLVSFYEPLHFLSPNEAINILQGVIQINPYGSLVAVPNTSAIVITDKTPVIQKSLALLQIIDREPSQIITEFIPLQRADAEKTVETLNQIFGGKESSAPQTPKTPTSPYQQPAPAPVVSSSGDEETRIFSGKVQFIPDKRTNRILLVTKAENYRYIRELISKLDQAVQLEQPLVRPLNYVSVTDVFPVLVDQLKNKDDDTQNNQNKTQQQNSQNPFANNNSNNNNNSSNPLGGSSSTTGSSGASGSTGADLLNGAPQLQPPQSAIIGSSSLIGDPTANSIIVYGPPETKIKARQIIDLLDHRPQQVYLAAVIGEMTLDEGMDYGASYLFHYQGFNALMNTFGAEAAPALFNTIGQAAGLGAGAINNAAKAAGDALSNAGAGGLTLFGSIGGSLDVYTKFLESTGKFRMISRPTVYTSNNRKATILSGQKIPYISSSLTSVVAGSTATNTANSLNSNITYQDVLLKLEVIPLINSDKEINLIIGQQNQTVNLTDTAINEKNQVNAPTINTQQLTTSVRIPNGSTIVLGGLISESKEVDEKGIPFIKDIPVIGAILGGSTHKQRKRHELVVMIQPIVVDSNFSMQKASNAEGAQSNLGKRAKELEGKLQPKPSPTPKKKKFQLFHVKKPDDF
ncbi:MAG: hypothetical protein FJ390_06805 [Verrucomicrobia bacterium]|nr:hypothetical protein [Verrucomicrobiota bacterium]